MNDRTVVVASLIVGGAIIAASYQRSRFALSASNGSIVWRMDTWSGEIDICAAAYLPTGPLVRCGATVVVPAPQQQQQQQPEQHGEQATPPPASLPPGTPL